MTTIAFDGNTIAADTQLNNSGGSKSVGAVRKIHPFSHTVNGIDYRYVFAISGILAPFPALCHWYLTGADKNTFPSIDGEENYFEFIVFAFPSVGPNTSVLYESGCGGYGSSIGQMFASGSGEMYARAILVIEEAQMAVTVATKLDPDSGLPIEAFDVHNWLWIKKLRKTPDNAREIQDVCKAATKERKKKSK